MEKRWLLLREADDRELVRRAREGRVEAFNALVTRWEKRIYNYLLRLAPDAEEAFDLAQETFLKAYQNLGRLDDAGRFGPWLYRIAHNEAISLLRRRRPEGQAPENAPEQASGHAAVFGMASIEVSIAVRGALGRLTAEQREAVVLKVCEGFKFEEIASILDAPASTVKSRVYSGLEALRGYLAPVEGAPGASPRGK